MNVLEMARKVRDDENPAHATWIMLHIIDWTDIEKRIAMHVKMVSVGIQEPDPVYQVLTMIGLSIGKISDDSAPES